MSHWRSRANSSVKPGGRPPLAEKASGLDHHADHPCLPRGSRSSEGRHAPEGTERDGYLILFLTVDTGRGSQWAPLAHAISHAGDDGPRCLFGQPEEGANVEYVRGVRR